MLQFTRAGVRQLTNIPSSARWLLHSYATGEFDKVPSFVGTVAFVN